MNHDIDAEQALLGSVLLSPNVITDLSVRPDDFFRPAHRRIYTAMLELHASGMGIDTISVKSSLGADIESCGGAAYLLDLSHASTSSVRWKSYEDIVIRASRLRSLVETGTEMVAWANGDSDPDEVIAKAMAGITAAEHGTSRAVRTDAVEVDFASKVEALHLSLMPRTPLLRGFFVGIGGRPSVGKSAFLAQVLYELANRHVRCRFYSYEMSAEDYKRRWVQLLTGIGFAEQLDGLPAEKVSAVKQHLEHGDWMRFVEIDDSKPSLPELTRDIRRFSRSGGWFVGIDHFQLLSQATYEDATETSRRLKLAANDTTLSGSTDKRPVVCTLSQLSRGSVRDDGTLRPPTLADFRQTGAIEQDVDVAVLLHHYDDRKDEAVKERFKAAGYLIDEFDGKKRLGHIECAKNRYGPTSRYPAWFDGPFVEWDLIDRTADERRAT